MVVLLYCCRSWRWNNVFELGVASARPVILLTSPPLDATSFPYRRFLEVEYAYIALHGDRELPDFLWGDPRDPKKSDFRNIPALSGDEIGRLPRGSLTHLIVFLEGCVGIETRVAQAFETQGATVIGSTLPTYDFTGIRIGDAGKVGVGVSKRLFRGKSVGEALQETLLKLKIPQGESWKVLGDPGRRLWSYRKSI